MKRTIIPSKEDILQYYIKENHSMDECAEHFGMSKTQFIRFRSQYGIYKPKSSCLVLVKNTHDAKFPIPPKEELERLFLGELKTKDYLAKRYHVSTTKISKWLKGYGIKKDPKLTAKTIGITTKEKYGLAFYKSEEAKEKTRNTCLERYGVDNPSRCPEIVQKIKDKTSIAKPSKEELYHQYIELQQSTVKCGEFFGVSRNLFEQWLKEAGISKSREQITSSTIKTNIAKYGSPSPATSKDVSQKIQQTCLTKYGVKNIALANIDHYDIWEDREKFLNLLQYLTEKDGYKPTAKQLKDYFGVAHGTMLRHIRSLGLEDYVDINPHRSSFEKEIVAWLKEEFNITNIEVSNRDILDGLEIDIYLPEYQLGIEFNGEFWHSELSPKFTDHGGRSHRHQKKSLLAESKGIFLFHIFEHEWNPRFTSQNPKFKDSKENIKNRLRALLGRQDRRIAARKCVVREIDEETKREFLDVNHIQRTDLKSAYALGLFFGEELVACMSFRKSKYRKYDWELSRFCTKHGTCVQGGASKLFSYFLRNKAEPGQKIVSYNDITKTKGGIYKTLGFECTSIGEPNYWWVNLDTYDIRSRYQEQAAGEADRMHGLGYVRVCDSGTRTWVYTKP